MISTASLCIVINGPSAVGKSTLSESIRNHWPEPLLRFGVDELYYMIPDNWAGGVPNALFAEKGFTYQDVPSMPGVRQIRNGADAIAMLYAMNAAIVAILQSGVGVLVDGQAFEPAVNEDLETRLRDLQAQGLVRVAVIELAAVDEQLADRQERHQHPVGLSLHHNALPKQTAKPDLVVNTTRLTASEVAHNVCGWLDENYSVHRHNSSDFGR